MKTNRVRQFASEAGDTMVEFSLVAVMFIVVLLGVVEMGRMLLVYTTLAQSARAGARYAIVHGADRSGLQGSGPNGPSGTTDSSQVTTTVNNFASAGPLNPSKLIVTVTYPGGTSTVGSAVDVQVSYTYDPLVTYYNPLLSVTLSSTSEGIIVF